ncbi:hypothetical protein PHLGIDRAFT_19407 [Phlebiopsis gigantea 11061_1 CR5-6]|uniref:Uncharacterized protein n=1 Tax=Phlebiopsis gigantea (strain 11061_1 CR5-6) TaxID=745531 RepID=A0A0C3S760_PHLG1|nr:hypothetical protein PHLGIDRAFT_19407 [Phlebiopsis gigantea 11061_1 CR5-6]
MASATSPLPLLPLYIPRSPLLSGSLAEDFTATLIAQGICNPLPTLSFSPAPAPSPRIRAPKATSKSTNKPLPTLPIPPRQIISLLDFLEKMDNDVTKEAQRVRENVKEARAEVRAYKDERERLWAGVAERKERERTETKGPDDEFWLNA